MAMNCVVCQRTISPGSETYANPWRAALAQHPCCSEACASEFSDDIHWLPGARPDRLAPKEEERLLVVAAGRLKDGDVPSIVVRDALLAGVPAPALRKIVNQAAVASSRNQKTAKHLSIIGVAVGLLTGRLTVVGSADKRRPELLNRALEDLDSWQDRFDKSPARP